MNEFRSAAPLLFCHYGNSEYLRHTFRAARLFNPDKPIILLGDSSNQHVARSEHIEHRHFSDYSNTEDIRTFDRVYRHISGALFNRPEWANFVIKRWFYVHSFLRQEGMDQCWHFDSDTLILSRLDKFEAYYGQFDYTEQCGGACMNGFIASFGVIDRYVKTINTLFQDAAYMRQQAEEIAANPTFAFTEMRAYQAFRQRVNTRSTRLSSVVNGGAFDDSICMGDGFETYEKPLHHHKLKKLYADPSGHIFCRETGTGRMVRMNSLNMSWVPAYLYDLVMKQAQKSAETAGDTNTVPDIAQLKVIDIFAETLSSRVLTRVNKFKILCSRGVASLKNRWLPK